MTISIHIEAHPDRGGLREQVVDSLKAIRFVPDDHHILKGLAQTLTTGVAMPEVSGNPDSTGDYQPGDEVDVASYAMTPTITEAVASLDEENAAPVRQRGKPGEGRARRTKAEIAEDEAADAKDAALQKAAAEANIQIEKDPRLADMQAISTGEERIGPDDAATEAQDRADEAAEAEAGRKGLTLDDLRQAVGAYQRKFGMAASVADVPQILGCKVVEVPEAKLQWAIDEMRQAADLNPFERNIVGGDMAEQLVTTETEKPAPAQASKTVTRDEVVAAMIAYAKKYDGPTADPANGATMPFANEDCPKVFKMLFGEEVFSLSRIPADPEAYEKTLAGLQEMTEKDPFKRGAK
jgi:hypothetical protein